MAYLKGKKNIVLKKLGRRSLSITKHVLVGFYELCDGLLGAVADPYEMFYGSRPGNYGNYEKAQFRKAVHVLKKRGLIKARQQDDKTLYELTDEGVYQAKKQLILSKFIEKKQGQWDGKWRLVIFDIPEEKRYLRNQFRKILKEIGFQMLQASVWAYPYDVFDDLDILLPDIKQHTWIKLLLVDVIVGENEFRKTFKL